MEGGVGHLDNSHPFRYEAMNAMLLNEFLKEHRKVEEQEATIAQLRSHSSRKKRNRSDAALKEQAAQLRKLSDQLAAVQTCTRLATNE